MRCDVFVETEEKGTTESLKEAWVYWIEAGTLALLRSDESGRLNALRSGGDKSSPLDYNEPFKGEQGAKVKLYFSRTAQPIADNEINLHNEIFVERTVTTNSSKSHPQTNAPIVEAYHTVTNLIVSILKPVAIITLPEHKITLEKPNELEIWPIIWEEWSAKYYTGRIDQAGQAWEDPNSNSDLKLNEYGQSSTAPDADRPQQCGFKIEGTIDPKAKGVKIKVIDQKGKVVLVKQDPRTTAQVSELNGALDPSFKTTGKFQGLLFLPDASDHFGLVQIVIRSEGLTPPIMEAFTVYLCGFQLALVDDYDSNANGKSPGRVLGESDELIVVDYGQSPQKALADMAKQTRVRRMICYQFRNTVRPLNSDTSDVHDNPDVLKPQMPMWMAEFHGIGITNDQLSTLMVYRHYRDRHTNVPADLTFDLNWTMQLNWHGPDWNSSAFAVPRKTQRYQQSPSKFSWKQRVSLYFDSAGRLTDETGKQLTVGQQGEVPNAFRQPPSSLNYPVHGRRLPQVFVSGQSRRWGRSEGKKLDTLVIEHQPSLMTDTGNEIVQGGDCDLKLELTVNKQQIAGFFLSGPKEPTRKKSDLSLPTFRVRGVNPTPADKVEILIDALVAEYCGSHKTEDHVKLLLLKEWQATARRILGLETGRNYRQFEDYSLGGHHQPRMYYSPYNLYYGIQADMPLFGPPHGYGIGQHDYPAVDSPHKEIYRNGPAWSFLDNVRESIFRIIEDKGREAYNLIKVHMPTPANSRLRAIFQREIVRRYNGGSEFRWNGKDWEIFPRQYNGKTKSWETYRQLDKIPDKKKGAGHFKEIANDLVLYPNDVLGDPSIQYYTGSREKPKFEWPITFPNDERPRDSGP